MTWQSKSIGRGLHRALLTLAACITLVMPQAARAQGDSVSFWFRLAPDSSVRADEVAIIDFFPEQTPLVRVHAGLATGREIENLKRTLMMVRRQNNGTFPVGRRLVIARDPNRAAPDTNRADAGGRREVRLLREVEQRAKDDPGVVPVIMTLVVDKGSRR